MNGVDLRERAAYFRATGSLVLADLHVGRDEGSAVEFPLGERADLADRLDALLTHFRPAEVVLAGDVLHSFRGVTDRVRESLADLVETCRAAGADPVLLAGNHDVNLDGAWDGPLHDSYRVGATERGDWLVCHGHETPDDDAERVVCGHDHPTVAVEGQRHPCYLWGPGAVGDLLMLPAFNRLAPGVEVNGMDAAAFDSPLVTDADALAPLVYDPDSQEVLRFPPLGEFRQLL